LRRREIAEQQIRRAIPVWGADLPEGGAVSREEIEEALQDQDGAYQRLRRVMDAWCALWFWPLTDTDGATPPTVDEWIDGLRGLLGTHVEARTAQEKRDAEARARGGQSSLFSGATWTDLQLAEEIDLSLANALPVAEVLEQHPWLRVCEGVAARQGFFHWELDFATVFAGGGFDLQVGNPPWVRPDFDEAAALGEFDARWALEGKLATARAQELKEQTLSSPQATEYYLDELVSVTASRALVGAESRFPALVGLRPDLYRCFMEQVWRNSAEEGISSLIHPESHFTDEKAARLRRETYARLRRHWQFINELQLYPEIHNLVSYGVHVSGQARKSPKFLMATSLYHPDTVEQSFAHQGFGQEPGLKDAAGKWDVAPHRARIIAVDQEVLGTWHALLEDQSVPVLETRMVYAVNRATAEVLAKLATAPRLGGLGLEFSQGWNETTDFKAGFFEKTWGAPDSWRDVILQGPHLFVSTPLYKTPNESMSSNKDWSQTDFETLAPDAIPVTSYKPAGDPARYDASYTRWSDGSSARDHCRIAWRRMAPNTGVRTLSSAIIPPGAAHVNPVFSLAVKTPGLSLPLIQAGLSALLVDALVRAVPKSEILFGTIQRLPALVEVPLADALILRSLRLNALTREYGELWRALPPVRATGQIWTGGIDYAGRRALDDVALRWTPDAPLRRASDRRQAQVEIDAIVALSLGITAEELCTTYRTQFPVLYGYDRREYVYDANGRLVPMLVQQVWRKKGDAITEGERTHTNASGNTYVYELPFVNLDREADMRAAYAHFERVLQEPS
jgi:hypothetical protein